MRLLLFKIWPILIFIFVTIIFFKPVFLEGKLPIPTDTIVGMYHPWRDFYAKDYPSGIPFKNFLITDPVRQQYVWRQLGIDLLKQGQLPLWNPYNFAGTPLLANFQSALFSPLNILFFILPFNFAWGVLVFSQPLFAAIFLYLYLRNLRLNYGASLIGGLTFAFSGLSIAWLEWNTILHSALWLPLIMLSIDKVIDWFNRTKISNFKFQISNLLFWGLIFVFSSASSFFAGHLQIFFYVVIFSLVYLIVRWWQYGKNKKMIIMFAICYLLFATLTAVQWVPTLQFINLSARQFDLPNWQANSWFLPWQNLIQFFAPDFFGNPATLNYWGEWNYGEFVGYIGILPLITTLLAILYRRDKKTLFFGGAVIVSLIFALPTPLAKLPYQWHLPFISTSQPTRLLFLVDFSLAILAALGLDWFYKNFNESGIFKKLFKALFLSGVVFVGLWLFILMDQAWLKTVSPNNLVIAKRNLIFPTILFISSVVFFLAVSFIRRTKKFTTISKAFLRIIYIIVVIVVVFDLFRFAWKFTPFTKEEWLFPQTKTIEFLKNQPKPFRFMTTDRRIFPPNFATIYRLEDISGYDPLYLKDYGELIAAWNRGKPDISPFSFNRILTPQDYSSKIADLLNVKYVLSLNEENSAKLKLVFQEGQTRLYENREVLPRVFFVKQTYRAASKEETIEKIFEKDFNPGETAITELSSNWALGKAAIIEYKENKIVLETENLGNGFLVLTDLYYPAWRAEIDGIATKIYQTDYSLRGVVVPQGKHRIEFKISLF